MAQDDDFFGGLKSEKDRIQEWTDAAQFYIEIRGGSGRTEEPEPVVEKTAGLGTTLFEMGKRFDPTGVMKQMGSKDARIAAGLGAAAFGVGTYLSSRGKKELGGQSEIEHSLNEDKKARHSGQEPSSFAGKMRNHAQDFTAGMASTARKHPLTASALGAIGGAKAGTSILRLLTKRPL